MNKPFTARCILWGGYGFGNVGDELTLAVALRDMRTRFGNSVAVLSPVPGYTKALFPDAEVIPYQPSYKASNRSLPRRIIRRLNHVPAKHYDVGEQLDSEPSKKWAGAVKNCELLYLVGGGYLTDLFDVQFNILPVELARAFGVVVETAPLGIGPFTRSWNANKTAAALRGTRLRVRDVDSQTLCHALGVAAECQRDDGFRVREVIEIKDSPPNQLPLIGINFFPQHGGMANASQAAWWRELLGKLSHKQIPVEGFCFHNTLPSDFSQTVQLFADVGLLPGQVRFPDWDFRAACQRLSKYRLIVTARFHAAVVAGVVGVPTVAISNGQYYSSKMLAACQGQAKSRVVNLNDMKSSQVIEIIEQLIP